MKTLNLFFLFIVLLNSINGFSQKTEPIKTDPISSDLNDIRTKFDSLRVSINPPLHFIKIDSLLFGFIHLGANASFVFAETDPIVYAVAPYYDSSSFAQNNETLISKDTLFMNNGYWGYQFVLQFMVQDRLVERIFFISGIDGRTIVVTANYPVEVHKLLYPVFIESLKTMIIEK